MNPELQQERIDDYLLGRGSAAERAEFEQLLEQNADLRQQLADTQAAMDAIELHADAQLKARLQQLEAGLASPDANQQSSLTASKGGGMVAPMKASRNRNRTWMAIAASLLLLLTAGWFIMRQPAFATGGELAMAQFEPYDNIAYTFERGTSDDSIEASAYRAYEKGDFAAAQSSFEKIDANPVRSFYLGQTLLAQSKFSEAATTYAALAEAESPFQQESEYYHALALVGLDRKEEARTLLRKITSNASHESYAEASSLLAKL
ncbi:hypothetical protein [Lewinella sp. 4G2]|uniref:hypothetical protein n=1 Tax=Lewinella sp. 4G2 TaxID=1803372 RepID=UPI0007B4F172|nr:hypothetical protein [Lewinella sp. 4G2]OAV43002.1 hypothetical protein A3850_000130 [Lewinella sp. 4G2]